MNLVLFRFVRYVVGMFVLFVLQPFYAFAQQAINSTSSLVLPPQFFRFVLITDATQKAHFYNNEGSYSLKSSVQPGFEGGIDYLHNINQTLYYSLGVHVMVSGRSTVFTMPALSSNPEAHYETEPAEKDRQFAPALVLPFMIEKEVSISLKKSAYVDAGVQLCIPVTKEYSGFGVSLTDSTSQYIEVYNQEVQSDNNGKLWLSYKLAGGMQWLLRNNNLLSIGIILHMSFTNFTRGTYQVTLPDQPITIGEYKASGSYIGISAGYSLTGKFRKDISTF